MTNNIARKKRQRRIRSKVVGVSQKPRLNVFRSNHFIYAQIIDDSTGKTLCQASDMKSKGKKTKLESSKEVGVAIATAAQKLKIDTVVFDRGGYKYHGRVKALAEGAKENGLKF